MTANSRGSFRTKGNFVGPFAPKAGAAAFVYALDGLSASSAAAFSTRKLRSAYAGQCMNVRRSSDNATQDIGFVNNVLDTTSLLAFVGANNGFVVTWYDQSGNGYNATQATQANQPQIVASGAVTTLNGQMAPLWSASKVLVNSTMPAAINAAAGTVNLVAGALSVGFWRWFTFGSSSTSGVPIIANNGGKVQISIFLGGGTDIGTLTMTGSTLNTTTCVFPTGIVTGTLSTTAYINGTSAGTINPGGYTVPTAGFYLGSDYNIDGNNANHAEFIIFPSALSTSDRQALEHNQESYYSIAGV